MQTKTIISLPNQVSDFLSELITKICKENSDLSNQSLNDPLSLKVVQFLSNWKNNMSQMSILAPNESTSDAHIARALMLEKLARIFDLDTQDKDKSPIESEIQTKIKSYGVEFEVKSHCIFNSLTEAANKIRENSKNRPSFVDLYAQS